MSSSPRGNFFANDLAIFSAARGNHAGDFGGSSNAIFGCDTALEYGMAVNEIDEAFFGDVFRRRLRSGHLGHQCTPMNLTALALDRSGFFHRGVIRARANPLAANSQIREENR